MPREKELDVKTKYRHSVPLARILGLSKISGDKTLSTGHRTQARTQARTQGALVLSGFCRLGTKVPYSVCLLRRSDAPRKEAGERWATTPMREVGRDDGNKQDLFGCAGRAW